MRKTEVVTAKEDKNDIEHVAFKNGFVYGLGTSPKGQRGIFQLQKDMRWNQVANYSFMSFETIQSNHFDFIGIMMKEDRAYVEFGSFDDTDVIVNPFKK